MGVRPSVTEISMIDLDNKIETVLAAYHQRMQEEQRLMKSLPLAEGMQRRDEFLLPVGEEVGYFLNMLVKSAQSKCILEIGTSYGYSTIWLAEAARQTGGKVITLEIDPDKVDYARQQLDRAGLLSVVECRVGDATQSIKEAEETFDFVLVDVWKELYVPSFERFKSKLKAGAYVIADNMIHPPMHHKEAKAYRAAVEKTGDFDSVLLPLGSGIELSHFKPDPGANEPD